MEELNIQDMSIEELRSAIESLQAEIDELKAELDKINEQLGDTSMESEAEPVYSVPEPPVDDDPEVVELKRRGDELIALITEKQMKLVAMKKRLDDLLADRAMDDYNSKEE